MDASIVNIGRNSSQYPVAKNQKKLTCTLGQDGYHPLGILRLRTLDR